MLHSRFAVCIPITSQGSTLSKREAYKKCKRLTHSCHISTRKALLCVMGDIRCEIFSTSTFLGKGLESGNSSLLESRFWVCIPDMVPSTYMNPLSSGRNTHYDFKEGEVSTHPRHRSSFPPPHLLGYPEMAVTLFLNVPLECPLKVKLPTRYRWSAMYVMCIKEKACLQGTCLLSKLHRPKGNTTLIIITMLIPGN